VPQQGVPMVRDPVCGTFVLPERAVSLTDGRTACSFCSNTCRDKSRPSHEHRILTERRHRGSRPAHVRARVHGVNDGNISVRLGSIACLMTPKSVLQGIHDARR